MGESNKTNKWTNMRECREVAPGLFGMEVGKGIMRSNVYFVRAGSSWVLVDAASANCNGSIRKTAESLFGANTRPAAIILTHVHPDHSGSALELARLWGCPVYVSPAELPFAIASAPADFEPYAGPLDRWLILPLLRAMPRRRVEAMFARSSLKDVVRTFAPGGPVPGLPGWECIPTPGHTPGHVAFFRTSDRVLVSGDSVVTVDVNSFRGFISLLLRINRQQFSGPPLYTTWNKSAAQDSVAALAGLEPRVVASGHGAPMTGDGTARELHVFATRFAGPRR